MSGSVITDSRYISMNGILEVVWKISFFLLMLAVICFGNIRAGTNYYYYFTFFLMVFVSAAEVLLQPQWYRRVYVPLQTIWYGMFVALSLLSAIWATSIPTMMLPMSRMVQILVLTNCLAQHIRTEKRLEEYMRIVLAASVFLAVFLLIRTPVSQWFSGFIGVGTGYNTNDIGLSLAISVIFAFFEAYIRRHKYCYAVTAFCFFVVILTSSRKAISMSILGMVLIVLFNFRTRKYVLRVLIIFVSAVLAIVLVFQIPQLYQVIGIRLQTMVEYFMSDKGADYSIYLRGFYIGIAQSILREHPLLGIGLNNFSYAVHFYGDTLSYCHNNYWEIAADLGIVGLLVYYWFYAYLLLKLIRQVFDGYKTALVFSVLVIQFLVFEYGIVNYYKIQSHLALAAAFCAMAINDGVPPEREERI